MVIHAVHIVDTTRCLLSSFLVESVGIWPFPLGWTLLYSSARRRELCRISSLLCTCIPIAGRLVATCGSVGIPCLLLPLLSGRKLPALGVSPLRHGAPSSHLTRNRTHTKLCRRDRTVRRPLILGLVLLENAPGFSRHLESSSLSHAYHEAFRPARCSRIQSTLLANRLRWPTTSRTACGYRLASSTISSLIVLTAS